MGDAFRWGPKATECIAKIEKGDFEIRDAGDAEKKRLIKDSIEFVIQVLKNLKARFPHTQQGVVEAAKNFNPGYKSFGTSIF